MPGLGANLTKKATQPLQAIKRLEWVKPDPKAKYGKNIGIVGQAMSGKTNLALQFGFFNSEYIPQLKKAGYNKVVDLLKSGVLAEINRIVVLESENNLRKALNDGIEKALYRPLIKKGILDIIPIYIPRKRVIIKDGKLIDMTVNLLKKAREEYLETVKQVVDESDEHTLFILDSATKYKKLLDDRLGSIIDIITNRRNASLEGLEKYTQVFYSHRNAEWEEMQEYKRGFKGWNIDTYKETATPQHYIDAGSDPLSTKWVPGTPHFLDMVFRITVTPTGDRMVEIADGKGRYLPTSLKGLKPFKIKLNSRFGVMPLIEIMSEKLMMGNNENDDLFW